MIGDVFLAEEAFTQCALWKGPATTGSWIRVAPLTMGGLGTGTASPSSFMWTVGGKRRCRMFFSLLVVRAQLSPIGVQMCSASGSFRSFENANLILRRMHIR